jgi:cytochrome c-type biogenesis protein CcmH
MKRLGRLALLVALFWSPFAPMALAVQPSEILDDPALEQRARDISSGLRCMVCQNQSIDDSDADLARDLRLLVRERLLAGDTDEEVVDYVVSRYGEFVLLQPRFSLQNALLWSAPAALLLIGGGVLLLNASRRRGEAHPLSGEEERRLRDIMRDSP